MFFPRLRRRAKWVFLVLAIAFAFAFVVAGVGTGLGSGIGDYLADIFNRQPQAGGESAEDARERLRNNPDDAAAQLDLANALQADGRTDEAVAALERYTTLRPKDTDALQQLAGLYLVEASEADERARAAQLESQEAFFADEIRDPRSTLAQRLGNDPVSQAVRDEATKRFQAAFAASQTAYRREAAVWQKLTLLLPEDAAVFRELGRASQFAGDAAAAIAAYERYLELAPDAADAAQVRAQIEQLRLQAGSALGS